MKKIIILLLLTFVCAIHSHAQRVKLITSGQLTRRLSQGHDTTYIVNFWATWCKPCIKELPVFAQIQQQLSGKPLEVIFVSTDDYHKGLKNIGTFVEKHDLGGEIYLMNEPPAIYLPAINKNWTGSLPATLVVWPGKREWKLYKEVLTYEQLLSLLNAD
ncbi:TlpA disulfide reductase family protein [Mucilaginibacter psychrotolerans]|uniref:TlpA family protein disulfide reductase n=1 Tax=Mucilaginibacter psychrotolerans TaxID=1524096 RepID=A0A4Y8SKY7_9SPHI|nr:TlpA disulfide reductase family protein [Mucilaginibacter psychrotolerans]TFF39719.1 TlpA family protein disulfide reductase [Mucilaginibacter psychrotolerans]